jgi:hypothetical protein
MNEFRLLVHIPLPDADGVRGGSLTTNDGKPMTAHVWSAMLTNLVHAHCGSPVRWWARAVAAHEIVPLKQAGNIAL